MYPWASQSGRSAVVCLFPLARWISSGSVIAVCTLPSLVGVGWVRYIGLVRAPSFRGSFGHLGTARASSRKARNFEFRVFL